MYEITKKFEFAAAHKLSHLEAGHPCTKTHGHNYEVIVCLRTHRLDKDAMVLDYHRLKPIKEWLDKTVDHTMLNEVFHFPATAEKMAAFFFSAFKALLNTNDLYSVTVKETPNTTATYYG